MITEQTTPLLSLTERAISEVKEKMAAQPGNIALRVGVTAGGCSGMTYQLRFDTKAASSDDYVFEVEGIRIVVDSKSAPVLTGMTLDFSRDLVGGGFKFINPNAKRSCGCGESFSA